MSVAVRPGVVDDAEAVARIHVAGWRHAYPGLIDDAVLAGLDPAAIAVRWRGWLERSASGGSTDGAIRHDMLVAEREGAVVGWATCGPARDAAREGWGELAGCYVDPAAARSGVGRTLVAAVERHLADAGFEHAYLWVLEGNAPAEAAYERYGWHEDGATQRDEGTDPTRVLVDRARVRRLR